MSWLPRLHWQTCWHLQTKHTLSDTCQVQFRLLMANCTAAPNNDGTESMQNTAACCATNAPLMVAACLPYGVSMPKRTSCQAGPAAIAWSLWRVCLTVRHRQNTGQPSNLCVTQGQCLVLHHHRRNVVEGVASKVVTGICSQQ